MSAPLVLDASVAAKWFWDEDDADPALLLAYGNRALHVPELFASEFSSIVVKRVRAGELSEPEGLWTFNAVMGRVTVSAAVPAAVRALKIAFATGLSAYDATYVALADEMDTRVITADERLVRAVAATPFAPRVALLGVFATGDS